MLLGSLSHVFVVGSNAGQTTFRRKVEMYWLPTPFACFPFTSPPVHHRVPPGSERAIPRRFTTDKMSAYRQQCLHIIFCLSFCLPVVQRNYESCFCPVPKGL